MAVYRKFYRSGTSVVLAIPFYMLEDMNVEQGDYALMRRLGASTIEITVKKAETVQQDRHRSRGTWQAAKPEILKNLVRGKKDLSS